MESDWVSRAGMHAGLGPAREQPQGRNQHPDAAGSQQAHAAGARGGTQRVALLGRQCRAGADQQRRLAAALAQRAQHRGAVPLRQRHHREVRAGDAIVVERARRRRSRDAQLALVTAGGEVAREDGIGEFQPAGRRHVDDALGLEQGTDGAVGHELILSAFGATQHDISPAKESAPKW